MNEKRQKKLSEKKLILRARGLERQTIRFTCRDFHVAPPKHLICTTMDSRFNGYKRLFCLPILQVGTLA